MWVRVWASGGGGFVLGAEEGFYDFIEHFSGGFAGEGEGADAFGWDALAEEADVALGELVGFA